MVGVFTSILDLCNSFSDLNAKTMQMAYANGMD